MKRQFIDNQLYYTLDMSKYRPTKVSDPDFIRCLHCGYTGLPVTKKEVIEGDNIIPGGFVELTIACPDCDHDCTRI